MDRQSKVKKIGGAAVEGFVNAGKKGSKTKLPTTGKKSATAAPKKPPTTSGQKNEEWSSLAKADRAHITDAVSW